MTATERSSHWNTVYTTKAEDSVSWFQPVPQISLDLIGRAGATAASAIIDIGGGASALVDHLLDAGHRDVSVLDIADSALAKTRARLGPERAGQVHWLVADIAAWKPARVYDIWHDRAVFHFLTDPADRAAYLAALRAGTKAGSQVIIGTFAADGPERCSGLPVQRYAPADLAATLGADFTVVEALPHDHRTPGGSIQKFQFSRFLRR